jgi:hypothetical protein
LLSKQRDERVDQRRLAGARRAGESRDAGNAGVVAQRILQIAEGRVAALDERDRPRQGADVTGAKAV